MRAMVFDRYGEPDVMGLREVPVPEPQDGEVLIRVGGRFRSVALRQSFSSSHR
jgi:hypothetical protein